MRLDVTLAPLAAACAAALVLACSGGTGAPGTSAASSSGGAANTTVSDDGGIPGPSDGGGGAAASAPLLCAPSSAMTSACNGLTAGTACTLTRVRSDDGDGDADDDAGVVSIAGTCRSTFDGTALACVPVPPVPPTALTQPCTGRAAGDACDVMGPGGISLAGTCFDAPGSGTLICGRVREPPQPLIDACSGKAAGATCALGERRDGGTVDGVCSNGPTGVGPLACAPVRNRAARLAAACDGLDAGTACKIGGPFRGFGGTCTASSAGGSALCLPLCRDLPFFPRPHRG
jgi:hypothetical protein